MSHNRCKCDPPLTIQEHIDAVVQVLIRQQMSGFGCEENEQALWQLRQTKALLATRNRREPLDAEVKT